MSGHGSDGRSGSCRRPFHSSSDSRSKSHRSTGSSISLHVVNEAEPPSRYNTTARLAGRDDRSGYRFARLSVSNVALPGCPAGRCRFVQERSSASRQSRTEFAFFRLSAIESFDARMSHGSVSRRSRLCGRRIEPTLPQIIRVSRPTSPDVKPDCKSSITGSSPSRPHAKRGNRR